MNHPNIEKCFYHNDKGVPVEGFLDDKNECKILFVLKEPNTELAEEFWFKKGVDQCGKGAKRYFHI